MEPTLYTPLPFGTYYYQELKKDYELWPTYNNPGNPHKKAIAVCPFWYWLLQLYCLNPMLNNPDSGFYGDMSQNKLILGLPRILGIPIIPGVPQLPYIVH